MTLTSGKNILPFRERQKRTTDGAPVIVKIVDGQRVEYVDIDAMTPTQRERYFSQSEDKKPS